MFVAQNRESVAHTTAQVRAQPSSGISELKVARGPYNFFADRSRPSEKLFGPKENHKNKSAPRRSS
jgi:hypothetical protein